MTAPIYLADSASNQSIEGNLRAPEYKRREYTGQRVKKEPGRIALFAEVRFVIKNKFLIENIFAQYRPARVPAAIAMYTGWQNRRIPKN